MEEKGLARDRLGLKAGPGQTVQQEHSQVRIAGHLLDQEAEVREKGGVRDLASTALQPDDQPIVAAEGPPNLCVGGENVARPRQKLEVLDADAEPWDAQRQQTGRREDQDQQHAGERPEDVGPHSLAPSASATQYSRASTPEAVGRRSPGSSGSPSPSRSSKRSRGKTPTVTGPRVAAGGSAPSSSAKRPRLTASRAQ